MNALAAAIASEVRPNIRQGPFEGRWDFFGFLDYFDRIGLPDAGRAMVLQAFSSEPVRLSRAGRKNVAGAFPSDKMGCAIQWESRGCERNFVYHCEYSADVLLYLCQPLRLELKRHDSKRCDEYTPDFLVLRADGPCLVECKTERELLRDQERSRPRFIREADGRWHHPRAEKALEDAGIRFEVFTPREAPPQWLRNIKWFRDFVGAPRPHPALLEPVLDAVRRAGSIRLRDLIRSPGATRESIWWAIANREIWGDWRDSLLFNPDFAWLHATKAEFLKHQHIRSVEPSEPDPAVVISFERDEIVLWNAIAWKVLHRGPEAVELQAQDGTRNLVSLRIRDAERLIRDGVLMAGPSHAPAVRRADEAKRRVMAASDKDIGLAEERMEAISYFKRNGHPPPDVGKSSVDRYMRWAREGEERYGNAFIGLIRRRGRERKVNLDKSLLPLVDRILHDHVTVFCNDENAPTQETAYGEYLADCKKRGVLKPKSRETFRREIKAYPLDRSSGGYSRVGRAELIVLDGYFDTFGEVRCVEM